MYMYTFHVPLRFLNHRYAFDLNDQVDHHDHMVRLYDNGHMLIYILPLGGLLLCEYETHGIQEEGHQMLPQYKHLFYAL